VFGRFFHGIPKPGIWSGEGAEKRYEFRPSTGRGLERREGTHRFATTFDDEFFTTVAHPVQEVRELTDRLGRGNMRFHENIIIREFRGEAAVSYRPIVGEGGRVRHMVKAPERCKGESDNADSIPDDDRAQGKDRFRPASHSAG